MMKKYLIIFAVISLTACSTTPVDQKLNSLDIRVLGSCDQILQAKKETLAKLSELKVLKMKEAKKQLGASMPLLLLGIDPMKGDQQTNLDKAIRDNMDTLFLLKNMQAEKCS